MSPQLDLWGPSETTPAESAAVSHGLRPYQEEAVRAIQRELEGNRSTLVVMPTGCHAPGQKVLRLDGALVAVENVRIGDLLMGPDSKPREVLCLHHGIGEMVAICPTKGSPWTVNRGHILTLVRTNDARKPGLVCDVSVDEWSRWSRTHKHVHKLFRTGVDFPQAKPLPVDPYFLGCGWEMGRSAWTPCAYSTKTRKCLLIWNHLPRAMGWSIDGQRMGTSAQGSPSLANVGTKTQSCMPLGGFSAMASRSEYPRRFFPQAKETGYRHLPG